MRRARRFESSPKKLELPTSMGLAGTDVALDHKWQTLNFYSFLWGSSHSELCAAPLRSILVIKAYIVDFVVSLRCM